MVKVEQIKELRDQTGVSVAECKKALEAAGGDMAEATKILQASSGAVATKKAGRQLGAGMVSAYIHTNQSLGVILELDCETDFVAKNKEFKQLADDLAMHVAAFAPADLSELAGQPFIKEPTLTVAEVITRDIQKFGEKIEIARFERLTAPGQ